MRTLQVSAFTVLITAGACYLPAQDPDAAKRKSAAIQWVADGPPLVYDVRFTGGDSTTMPTALKYLVKDLAASEGWYLTGEDKSKTVSSTSKRISLDVTKEKSKLGVMRVSKIDVKELPNALACVVTYSKKPAKEDVARIGGVLETFGRKYLKIAKGIAATVAPAEAGKANVWAFDVHFIVPAKEPAKEKK